MNISTILRRAADLIDAGWTQNYIARDKYGHPLKDALDPRAVRVCASGAICKAAGISRATDLGFDGPAEVLRNYINRDRGDYESIPAWNDAEDRTKADVVAAFRAASESVR